MLTLFANQFTDISLGYDEGKPMVRKEKHAKPLTTDFSLHHAACVPDTHCL